MSTYTRYAGTIGVNTPQTSKIPGSTQVENKAGGFAWKNDVLAQVQRFLILGTAGNHYYVKEDALTAENADIIKEAVVTQGEAVVKLVVEISDSGRAPKNDPALFVLAVAAGIGDDATRKAALQALPKVARIGTHLYHFAQYVEGFRGWGRGLRNAIGAWYENKSDNAFALDAIKYRQRDGWTHRDLLRLSHPKLAGDKGVTAAWITGKSVVAAELNDFIKGYVLLQQESTTPAQAAKLIRQYGLPREAVQTQHLNSKVVWEALLENMPMTALVRNLGVLSKNGVLVDENFSAISRVVAQLTNQEAIKKSRLHPLTILIAQRTYERGYGLRGNNTWPVNRQVVAALEKAFFLAFDNVESTGKNIVIGVDVSGSMGSQFGDSPLRSVEAAAALSLVTAKTEQNVVVRGFAGSGFIDLGYGKHNTLKDATSAGLRNNFGFTDASIPIQWALDNNVEADAFIVITDNETYAGNKHPSQALKAYNKKTGRNAKLVFIATYASAFTLADPNDANMLDVAGFDTAVPTIVREFLVGNV